MLCGLSVMLQAAIGDGLAFDPFAFYEDGLIASEVDVSRGKISDAFMIAPLIVMLHGGIDLGFEIARQVVVFQQDAVLEGLVPALDLALGHGMIRRSADMGHPIFRSGLSRRKSLDL